MKRHIRAALAASLLVPGLWAALARAQDDGAPPPAQQDQTDQQPAGDQPDQHPGGKMNGRMKRRLELTDDQAAKLADATKAHGEAVKPLGRQMKDAIKKLREQLKAKAADDEIQTTLDSLKTARKAMADEDEKFHDALAAFLTPTQRAKLAVGMAMRMRERREERAGRSPRGHKTQDGDEQHDDGGEQHGSDGGQ